MFVNLRVGRPPDRSAKKVETLRHDPDPALGSEEFARDDNRRKSRSGSFWEGRYHATMVDSGEYLWQCLKYVELNMVRCGVVGHPRQWEWSGYAELMGGRKRNQLLDAANLLFEGQNASMGRFWP